MDYSLQWGRSAVGCDTCGTADALAGWELRLDGTLYARLCSACAGRFQHGELTVRDLARIPDGRSGRRAPRRHSA